MKNDKEFVSYDIVEKIQLYRAKKGLTKNQLTRKVGFSIADLENQKSDLTDEELSIIKKVLDMP